MPRLKIATGFLAASLAVAFMAGPAAVAAGVPDINLVEEPNPQFVPYDSKTYPGINCKAQTTSQAADFQNFEFWMVNGNAANRSVVCPIVRDNTSNLDGTFSVRVNVGNAAKGTLTCTLYSDDKFGVRIDSNQASTTAGGEQTLLLDVDMSVEGGYYGIICSLPSTATLRSYEVREFLETDNRS